MSIALPNDTKRGPTPLPPILRAEIEEAQRHTNSNMAAARYLNVSYKRYRKYAKLYGIFDQHLNVSGVGIDKGWSKKPTSIPLRDILAGKHPDYNLARLKNRLIARKKLPKQCALCGFHEERITDQQSPLMLRFKDGNRKNFSLENLELYCYNCMFLTTGAPTVVYREQITRSFENPDSIRKANTIPPKVSDSYDPEDEQPSSLLTEEERLAILREIHGD